MSKPAFACLRKDLRITRLLWAPMAFSYGVFLLMFMENVWIYLATGACLAFVMAATAAGIDDYYRAEAFFSALPGTRRSLVEGRYLAWGLATAAGLALFLGLTAMLHAGFGARGPRLVELLSLKGATAFLAATVLAGSAFLPFFFRFGFWPGMWRFTAACLALSVIVLNVASLVAHVGGAGDAQAPAAGVFGPTGRGLHALAGFIDGYLGRPGIAATTGAVLALGVYVSIRLSVGFYRKRDL